MSGGGLLLIGDREREALAALRERAAADPVDILALAEQLKSDAGKRRHMQRMARLSVEIPTRYTVCYSVEHGHGAGPCRHMSMSSDVPDRVPRPESVWIVAELLGFVDGLGLCKVWKERFTHRGLAINVVQPLNMGAVPAEGPLQ